MANQTKSALEIMEGQVQSVTKKITKLEKALVVKVGGREYRKLSKKMERTKERMEKDQRYLAQLEMEMEALVEDSKPVAIDTEAVEAEIESLKVQRNQYEKAVQVLSKTK